MLKSSLLQQFLKKWAIPGLFFVYFRLFQTNNTIFTTNECEKMSCPSSIRRQDSNPRPLERESPPITTRPGLPPMLQQFVIKPLPILWWAIGRWAPWGTWIAKWFCTLLWTSWMWDRASERDFPKPYFYLIDVFGLYHYLRFESWNSTENLSLCKSDWIL